MKKLFTNLKVALTLLLLCGVCSAWADEVTSPITIVTNKTNVGYSSGTVTLTNVSDYKLTFSSVSSAGAEFIQNAKNSEIYNTVAIPYTITSIKLTDCATTSTKTDGSFKVYGGTSADDCTNEVGEVTGLSSSAADHEVDFNDGGDYTFFKIVVGSNRVLKISSIVISFSSEKTPVSSITVSPIAANVMQGKKLQLTTTILPDDASNKKVTWSSTNPKVTVDENGLVNVATDATPGSNATITATAMDESGVTGTCTITVDEYVLTWANTYTSNIALPGTGGCKVIYEEVSYDGIKAGTSSVAGSTTITVPANTKTLHMHLVGWNDVTVTLKLTEGLEGKSFDIESDPGILGNTHFTLEKDAEYYYVTYDVTDPEEHNITLEATSGNRFVLFGVNAEAYKTQNIPIFDAGYATAYIPFDATVEGATAYYVTVEGSSAKLNEITGTIPANTGVVLQGTAGTATFTETTVAATTDVTNNLLDGTTDEDGKDFEDSGFTYYILANGSDGIGFYWDGENYDEFEGMGAHCAQYKAILAVPTSTGAAPRFFSFDEASGINAVTKENVSNGARFNLNGQVVGNGYKGIIIMNGKKFYNK